MSRRVDNLHVFRLIPPRPTFDQDMDEREREIMNRHVEYWGRLMQERGRILVFGPVRDSTGAWGLGVIESDSDDEVRALIDGDPANTSGLARFEIGRMPAAVVPD